MNVGNHQDYVYDPTTGTYVLLLARQASPAPPLPPKELDPSSPPPPPRSKITKESQLVAELEGDVDSSSPGRSSESLSAAAAAARRGEKARRDKRERRGSRPGRVKFNVEPRERRQLRILSLDGGGIRGYSTLVILQELMHQIYVQTHRGKGPRSPSDLPRPCDYFDLIGGTGTGGLIALMLGRMRMDVESCKDYYVRLTRYVFITDKTWMGLPYGKTLFKASRLESAIKHCVQESTASETSRLAPPDSSPHPHPPSRRTSSYHGHGHLRRGSSTSGASKTGNPNAPLFDDRPNRCPTLVTAVYQGTPPNSTAPPALLRTYPSAAESAPSYDCTIWQAGRATSATLSAFKPITIGQNTFLDEGSGKYNPAIAVLEEVRQKQFPNEDIALFVSVGTGKPPASETRGDQRHHRNPLVQTHFSEARRRAQSKLAGAEAVHRALLDGEDGGRPALAKNGVAKENYYRFNVEVGVGEFALNEWNRLAEVSTSTRRYLQHPDVSRLVRDCAAIMVNIEKENKKKQELELELESDEGGAEKVTTAAVGGGGGGGGGGGFVPANNGDTPIAELSATEEETRTERGGGGGGGGGYPPPPPPPPPPIERVDMPDHRHHLLGASPLLPPNEHPFFRTPAVMPNPEIRVTSPSIAGWGNDGDSDGEDRYHHQQQRQRQRQRQHRRRS